MFKKKSGNKQGIFNDDNHPYLYKDWKNVFESLSSLRADSEWPTSWNQDITMIISWWNTM